MVRTSQTCTAYLDLDLIPVDRTKNVRRMKTGDVQAEDVLNTRATLVMRLRGVVWCAYCKTTKTAAGYVSGIL